MKQTNKVTVLAEITILSGFEKVIKAAAETVWEETKREPGCEAFHYTAKKDTDNTIVFFEIFRSQADFEVHVKEEHTKAFLDILKGKVEGNGPKLTFLDYFGK